MGAECPHIIRVHTDNYRNTRKVSKAPVAGCIHISVTNDYLGAEITKGCRARNVHLTHPKCIAAIDAWLNVRRRRGWGLSRDGSCRGFLPHTKLVLIHKFRCSLNG
ncbi:hypothetical protein GCM10007159_40550 [Modicisalibacter luteus]|nr:hypothetical protein GCM10007159_40550 [Halomonas lutea]